MYQALHQRGLWSLDELSLSDAQTLLSTAQALKQSNGGGSPLKGKHVAVLCERPLGAAADVFTAAARGLGAQVTRIRPSASGLTESGELQDTARVLGRLYDAIECDGLGQAFMLELARTAAVPLSNVLLQECHPTRMLADVMTMQEIAAEPFRALTVRVACGERTMWGVAWRQIAAVTGIDVIADAPAGASGHNTPAISFVCDPQGQRCADGHPALLAVHRDDPVEVSLAQRQMVNHRFVVQALLTHTLN